MSNDSTPKPPQRILIADDDIEMRALLKKTLTHEGFEIETVPNGVEALNRLAHSEKPFDLMISDLRMPIKGGDELLAEARQLFPELRIIMISGYAEMDQYLALLKQGAFDFVTKPFKIPDLLDVIDRALGVEP